ncbi:MAG: hypothetical protein MR350_02315 [Alphaproteobacteria bacterium]|nr:hypothetical protein [Alphaproteobacteria bacterium]
MGSIKTAMVVLWLTLTLFVAVAQSVLKNRVQGLERRLDTINENIQKDIRDIHILKAEWSLNNSPERLKKLAYEQLSLEKAKPEQIINYSALHFNYEDGTQAGTRAAPNRKGLTTLVKAEVKKK